MYKIYIKYTKQSSKKFLYCKMLSHFVVFKNYNAALFEAGNFPSEREPASRHALSSGSLFSILQYLSEMTRKKKVSC